MARGVPGVVRMVRDLVQRRLAEPTRFVVLGL